MRNKPRNIVHPVKIELKDRFSFLELTGTRCCKSAVFNPAPTFTRTEAQDLFNDLRYYALLSKGVEHLINVRDR